MFVSFTEFGFAALRRFARYQTSAPVWLTAALGLWFLAPPSRVLGDVPAAGASVSPSKLGYNRDVRPVLSDNCFACHGPDKNQRKVDLRFDVEAEAFADRGGYSALVKGKPEASELFKRITRKEKSGRMPPAKTGKHLTAQQVELIR